MIGNSHAILQYRIRNVETCQRIKSIKGEGQSQDLQYILRHSGTRVIDFKLLIIDNKANPKIILCRVIWMTPPLCPLFIFVENVHIKPSINKLKKHIVTACIYHQSTTFTKS